METRAFEGQNMELPKPPDEPEVKEAEPKVTAPELSVDEETLAAEGIMTELQYELRSEVRDEPQAVPISSILSNMADRQPKIVKQPVSENEDMPKLTQVPPDTPSPTPQPPKQGTGMYGQAIRAGFLVALLTIAVFTLVALLF